MLINADFTRVKAIIIIQKLVEKILSFCTFKRNFDKGPQSEKNPLPYFLATI